MLCFLKFPSGFHKEEERGKLRGMGKHGPCRHCGVTTTPLWRNGPPDKPVLCNACGSRWRTKGSLTNYTPLHAREPIDPEVPKVYKVKSITFKPKEKKLQKIKEICGAVENENELPYSDQNFRKILEGDTSNWSSSGSATSYSESCAYFGTTEASDLTGSAQSNVWESQVPSKKRTCVIRAKPSPLEKLTKDLYTIMHEQQSSYFSSSSELLYGSETPMGSFEIGNGSVLLRYPNLKVVEEESEASSLPMDNKSFIVSEAYSGSASFNVHNESKGASFSAGGIEKLKKSTALVAQGHIKRDKFYTDKLHILRDRDSSLGFIDLKDVVNFDVLTTYMTEEEQHQLVKYLPSTDTAKFPESFRTMFNSSQFVETLLYFQQLLQEGIFDSSNLGTDIEENRSLRRLVLQNLSRSTWIEHHKKLKGAKINDKNGGIEVATDSNHLGHSNFMPLKRARDTQNLHVPELKSGTMRSPKRVAKSGDSATKPQSSIYDTEDFVGDNDGSCFSPRTIFATPNAMLCSLQFTDDSSSNHDLLLDVRGNTSSFLEAQFLYHPSHHKHVGRNNSPSESGVIADGEESLSNCSI